MDILSTEFENGGEIPTKYTCEGDDISPPLSWKGVPPNAKSLVLIMEDPDAPDPKAPKMLWIHWVLYNMEPASIGLNENVSAAHLPTGTLAGLTSWKKPHYGGPCPPIGQHRYYFKLFALDTQLPDLKNPTAENLKEVIKDHIIASAELMGTYQKRIHE